MCGWVLFSHVQVQAILWWWVHSHFVGVRSQSHTNTFDGEGKIPFHFIGLHFMGWLSHGTRSRPTQSSSWQGCRSNQNSPSGFSQLLGVFNKIWRHPDFAMEHHHLEQIGHHLRSFPCSWANDTVAYEGMIGSSVKWFQWILHPISKSTNTDNQQNWSSNEDAQIKSNCCFDGQSQKVKGENLTEGVYRKIHKPP